MDDLFSDSTGVLPFRLSFHQQSLETIMYLVQSSNTVENIHLDLRLQLEAHLLLGYETIPVTI